MIDLTTEAPWKKIPKWLFNQANYVFSKETPQRITFYDNSRTFQSLIHLYLLDNKVADSGWGASFGAADYKGKNPDLVTFYDEVIQYGRVNGWSEIIIRHWPKCYQPIQFDLSMQALLTLGFQVEYEDINYHVPITFWAPKLAENELRRLKKCIKVGMIFKEIVPENWESERYYQFIAANRQMKGYELSLNQNQFVEMLVSRPNDHKIFGVFHEDLIVAIAVCVIVSPQILYVFYPADDYSFRLYSPNVMLYSEIVKWAAVNGFNIVDYGTASVRGEKNEGLIKFKEKIGGYASIKPSLIYRF